MYAISLGDDGAELRPLEPWHAEDFLAHLERGRDFINQYIPFAAKATDETAAFFGWPSGWLLSGSACALVAAVLGVLTLGVLPMVWRGGRRVDSWSGGRKVAFTFTALLFVSLSVLLGAWGYLLPWS